MHVFLSYNNRDREIAQRVCAALRNARPGLDVYFAPDRNQVGAYWMNLLGQELAESDAVVLLLGEHVGVWQEIEYYDALKRNRMVGRPLIAPVALGERLPGLPFLDHFHRLIFDHLSLDDLTGRILSAIDGAGLAADDAREPLWRQVNPYVGLPAMQTEDSAFFVGREDLTALVLDALSRRPNRIHTLIGSSGVGKSSLALAGVLAALRSRLWPGDAGHEWPSEMDDSPGWLPLVVTPGPDPCKELARAIVRTWLDQPSEIEREAVAWSRLFRQGSKLVELARAAREEIANRTGADPPARVMLYIDQGEELYTRADSTDRAIFSRLIADAVAHRRIMIMASLRADYYGQWQADEPFFRSGDRIDVPPLTREQIERVVREPAERLGVRFDNPEIVSVIAEATYKEPGSLPMLSYLMQDAWEAMRRDDASNGTLAFPFRIVDVSRPLVDRAERFLKLHPGEKSTLRRLLTLRLAHVPGRGQPVRRRARRSDCTAAEWKLANELAGGDWRLLTTSDADEEPVAEVAHEALLRHWPRLSRWLDAERDFLVWKGQLETARLAWDGAPADTKDQALLWGLALTTAAQWRAKRGDELSDANRDFIDLSIRHADQAIQRKAKQRRWIRRTATAAMVVLVGLCGFAVWQAVVAENALSRSRIDQARSRAILAEILLKDGNFGEAIAVAATAMPQAEHDGQWPDISDIMEVPRVLAAAILGRREMLVLRGHLGALSGAMFSPDGSRILTVSADGTARLWDTASGRQLSGLDGHQPRISATGYSPANGHIVTADDHSLRFWDGDGRELSNSIQFSEDDRILAVSPDGSCVATIAETGIVSIRHTETEEEPMPLGDFETESLYAVISPDGGRILIVPDSGIARLWDTATGTEIAEIGDNLGSPPVVVFSPDGGQIVTASKGGDARLWDAEDGHRMAELQGHRGDIVGASFSAQGDLLATTSTDDTARLWNARTGQPRAVLNGHADTVTSATFSADEARIVTASLDDTARIWDTQTGLELVVLSGHDDDVAWAAFSPDGHLVVTAGSDNTARVWDSGDGLEITRFGDMPGDAAHFPLASDGNRVVTMPTGGPPRIQELDRSSEPIVLQGHPSSISAAVFSPDGELVATADNQVAWVWNTRTGERVAELEGHGEAIVSMVFSPDGTNLVTTSWDDTARIWDAMSGDVVDVLRGHASQVTRAAYSPDGSQVATIGLDNNARVWDAPTGDFIAVLRGHEDRLTVVTFSPDGDRLVTATEKGAIWLWDIETRSVLASLDAHTNEISAVSFAPDGSLLVTASFDSSVLIWDAETHAPLHILTGHEGYVYSAVISADGARLLTASQDDRVRLWNTRTGDLIAVFSGSSSPVESAVFSGDGSRIIAASRDRSVLMWRHFRTMDDLWQHASAIVDQLQPLTRREECDFNIRVDDCERREE